MVTAQKVNNRLPKNTTAKDAKALPADVKAVGDATEGKSVSRFFLVRRVANSDFCFRVQAACPLVRIT